MKRMLACMVLGLVAAVPVAPAAETRGETPVCARICNYERLGIDTYVDACMQGCRLFEDTYLASGDKNSALAKCKSGCASASRNICEYGCNAARRSLP